MLCLPIQSFCDAETTVTPADLLLQSYPVALSSASAVSAVSASTASPATFHHHSSSSSNNNNNSSSSSSSSSSLYSIPLPPHPLPLDSFSTPSSSTPCSLPAIRSWQHLPASASASSSSSSSLNNTTSTSTSTSAPVNTSFSSSSPKQQQQQQQQPPLVLDPLTASKVGMAENLVDTTALIIESIWPSPSGAQYSNKAPVIPLHIFVKETLRRSRTTLATLQLALYYIYKVRNQVLAAQEKIRLDQIHHQQQRALQMQLPLSPNGSIEAPSEEEFNKPRDYFHTSASASSALLLLHHHQPISPPGTNNTNTNTNNTPASSLSPLSLSNSSPSSPILAKSEPVGCGRRMFLAALILASKFQQDRTYSNKAWSKISGLPVSEINLNEITFLKLIDYRLFVSQAVFQKWITILAEKGRNRANLTRSCSMDSPKRRSSIQYCSNNTLPSRMTCVTASSLEQQVQQHQPHLPSFSFILEKQKSLPAVTSADAHFDFAATAPLPTLPKLSLESTNSLLLSASGLVQSEALPRQQQGMGAYLTHRWVQAQRREYLKSRMQTMGFTLTESPRSSPLLTPQALPASRPQTPLPTLELQQQQQQQQEPQVQYGMILNNYQNNIITYSPSRTFSLDRTPQRSDSKLFVSDKHKHVQDFMPSPAPSPKAIAGMKRRASEAEESDAASANDMQSRTRRRLSVSFLVDC